MVLVDRWNGSHGAAVSKIGVVLAPSAGRSFEGKGLEIWTVGDATFSGRSHGTCTLGGCTSIGTLGVWMGNCGNGGTATARPRRVAI
jgi:hypothetical protein